MSPLKFKVIENIGIYGNMETAAARDLPEETRGAEGCCRLRSFLVLHSIGLYYYYSPGSLLLSRGEIRWRLRYNVGARGVTLHRKRAVIYRERRHSYKASELLSETVSLKTFDS